MSWFPEKRSQSTWLHRTCTRILKSGPIPKHIAIIMDGNRRFAQKNSMDQAEGHLKGFDKLAETLEWCLNLGIMEVTVYAFSIENFKRSKAEVDCLMELSRQKFTRLLEERELIEKHGVCIRVLGNLSLLPPDIQKVVADAVNLSKHNTRAKLNVCLSYTSRDEIATAMREMAEGVDNELIKYSDISEELLEKCLYTHQSQEPDLLIRTSGEVRLSDFLLWQSTFSVLSFMKVLWPDFSVWHMYAAILHYQRHHETVTNARQNNQLECERRQRESDYNCVMERDNCDSERSGPTDTGILHADTAGCEDTMTTGCEDTMATGTVRDRVSQYALQRQQRTQLFLQEVYKKRSKFFEDLSDKNIQPVASAVVL